MTTGSLSGEPEEPFQFTGDGPYDLATFPRLDDLIEDVLALGALADMSDVLRNTSTQDLLISIVWLAQTPGSRKTPGIMNLTNAICNEILRRTNG